MFGRILVPLDGSRFAESVLPLARSLARSARARLDLVLVHETMPAWGGDGEPVDLLEDRFDREQAYLAEVTDLINPDRDITVGWTLLRGRPAEALERHVASVDADLVVMATHGRGVLSRLWLGSVADHLARHLATPVLLLRPDPDFTWADPQAPRMRSVLVALDGSAAGTAIIPQATVLARLLRAHLLLAHVVEPVPGTGGVPVPYPVSYDARLVAARPANAPGWLDDEADAMRSSGLSVSSRVVVGAPVARTLLEVAAEQRVDVIACAPHGGGMRRLVLGSVADKLVRGSRVPVLMVPPPVVARELAATEAATSAETVSPVAG